MAQMSSAEYKSVGSVSRATPWPLRLYGIFLLPCRAKVQKTASGATVPILQATDCDWLNVSGRGVSVKMGTEIPLSWGFIEVAMRLTFDLVVFTRYQVFSFGAGFGFYSLSVFGFECGFNGSGKLDVHVLMRRRTISRD